MTHVLWRSLSRFTAIFSARRVAHLSTAILLMLSAAVPGMAATLTVTSLADDGTPGTLRSIIGAAAPGDTINFNVSGTITLAQGTLDIINSVTISGPGATSLAIDGANAYTAFAVENGAVVSISGLTIRNAYNAYYGGWGGAMSTKAPST